MGDDHDRAIGSLPHFLKHLDQVLEAPEIDTGLRLVKHRKLCAPGQDGGDLDPL